MRIACPNCRAQYEVPDATVASARVVRCARCAQEWAPAAVPAGQQPTPPPPVPEPDAADWPMPEQPPPAEPLAAMAVPPAFGLPAPPPAELRLAPAPAPPVPLPRRRGPLLAWAASLVLLLGAMGAAYAWRGRVMQAWPPSERMYAALRLSRPAAPANPPPPNTQAPAPRAAAH